MMTKLRWIAPAAFVVALGATSVSYAQAPAGQASAKRATGSGVQMAQAPQPGPGRGGGWGEMSEAERAKMLEQMMQRMLEESGLTAKEKAAATKTIRAKVQARQALTGALDNLRRAANKAKPTDKELREALAAYQAALAQYRKKVAAEDAALVKQLSLKGQVRCLSLGILDNGLGGGGRMGMGGGTGRSRQRG